MPAAATDSLDTALSPVAATWLRETFPNGPTPAQAQGWPAIAAGGNVLLCAPTGSGKTLACSRPAGRRMPQIVPDAWYSFQPEPTT